MPAVRVPAWDGDSYLVSPVSVFSFGKGVLGIKEIGAWHCGECRALQRVHSDALHGCVSAETAHLAGDAEARAACCRVREGLVFKQVFILLAFADI